MRCWRGRGQKAPHGAGIGKGSDQTYNILFQYKDGHDVVDDLSRLTRFLTTIDSQRRAPRVRPAREPVMDIDLVAPSVHFPGRLPGTPLAGNHICPIIAAIVALRIGSRSQRRALWATLKCAHAAHRIHRQVANLGTQRALRRPGALHRLVPTARRADLVRSKYSADPQVSIVQQVVTVTANRSQPWLSPNVFPLCV